MSSILSVSKASFLITIQWWPYFLSVRDTRQSKLPSLSDRNVKEITNEQEAMVTPFELWAVVVYKRWNPEFVE
jgi:hypothetical protein